jgi:proteasome lid subunit RPN8/RPN11
VAEPKGREICGLILDNGYLLELLPVKNQTRAPGSFAISWKRWRKARRAARRLGHRVVGTFHSHPVSEAAPGPSDIQFAREGDLMLIFSCWDREARLWHIREGKAMPLTFEVLGGSENPWEAECRGAILDAGKRQSTLVTDNAEGETNHS